MPIESPVAWVTPCLEIWLPRMMLPPPTTMATWVPIWLASLICRAIDWTSSMSIPVCPSLQNASPLILSRTRLYLGCGGISRLNQMRRARARNTLLADFHPHEAPERDVLLELRDFRLQEVAVGSLEFVLLGVGHVQEALLGVEVLFHLAFDDFGGDLGRLALDIVGVLRLLDLHQVGRQLVLGDDHRIEGRDGDREFLHQGLELLVLGDEVRVAGELDHRADLAVGMDIGADTAFLDGGADALGGDVLGLFKALLLDDLLGLVPVPAGLLERALAVHHAGAGLETEIIDGFCVDVRHGRLCSCGSRGGRSRRRLLLLGLGGT